MEDLKKIQEFFSKPLNEEKEPLDIIDFAKVVKAVQQTGHPVTVLLVPKFNEIEVLTGMNTPDDMLRDLSNAVDSLGYGRNDIIIAGDSSNLSRREYSDIRRVNGGAKDYFEEAIAENDSYARVSKPRFIKDKNNPNFLNVYLDYDIGPGGHSMAFGKETMSGQIRRLSSAKARKIAHDIALDLEANFNLEDIEVTDLKNGKVRIFAVSDDFIDMDPNMLGKSVNEVTRYGGFIRNPEDPDSEPFNPTGSVAEFREDLRALFGKFKGDLKNPEFIKGVAQIMVNWKSLLRSQLDEQADHVSPMVVKAYKDYIKAKKDSAADVDFAEDPEKAYRYYSKKLNNTYSTRADRDAIEAILKKKYGSALEENKPVANVNRHIKAIQIQLDQLGVKYEMSGNPYKPFKAVYKPINKDDKWYDNFEDIVFRYNLGGVVKTSMDEATKDEETTFHKKLDKLVHDTFGKRKGELEESSSSEEKRIAKRAIKSIAKYRGVSEDEARNDLIRAAKELGSLKENMSLDDQAKAYYLAKVKRGEIDTLPEDPKAAFLAQMTKDQIDHDKETLRRERGLEEKAAYIAETIKLGMMVNEDLCEKGKRYIKARQAAGEKSSAYLSGRAVRVCKGQIEWPKKGKKKK